MMSAVKNEAITLVLNQLTASGCDWELEDHWEGDLTAVGVCRPCAPGRLAYVSVFGQEPGNYYVELEMPGPGDETYRATRTEAGLSLVDAAAMIADHLALEAMP